MPTGRARERTYPRSVGVLGHGFLAEPVLQRLLHTLPAATQSSHTAGILTCSLNSCGWEPNALPALQISPRAASTSSCCCRNWKILRQILSGPSGFQAGVHSPTILVVGAISTPDDLRNLAGELVEKTAGLLRIVDAPLSGTPAAAARGELSIVVGADPGLYRDSLPVLELLGTCVRVGGVGSAQIANACEQYVIAATAMALSEAAVIAERAGLDLLECCTVGSSRWQGAECLARHVASCSIGTSSPIYPPGPHWRRSKSRLSRHGERALQRGC